MFQLSHHMTLSKQNCAFESCADSEGPDQTAHTRSLIRTYAVANRICRYYNVSTESGSPDETEHAHGDLIVRMLHIFESTFSLDVYRDWLGKQTLHLLCIPNIHRPTHSQRSPTQNHLTAQLATCTPVTREIINFWSPSDVALFTVLSIALGNKIKTVCMAFLYILYFFNTAYALVGILVSFPE